MLWETSLGLLLDLLWTSLSPDVVSCNALTSVCAKALLWEMILPLLQQMPVKGLCRVMCFSPRHDLTLAQMQTEEIHAVINTWAEQVSELSSASGQGH